MKNLKQYIDIYMEYAYLAGRWRGQVDLEESMDSDFCLPFLEYLDAQKTCLPMFTPSTGRTVQYNLRSDRWRKEVKKNSLKDLEEASKNLSNYLKNPVN